MYAIQFLLHAGIKRKANDPLASLCTWKVWSSFISFPWYGKRQQQQQKKLLPVLRMVHPISRNFFVCFRRPEFYYSCGRSSVIWDVKPAAKKATATNRVRVLAEPKKIHQDYKENMWVPSMIKTYTRKMYLQKGCNKEVGIILYLWHVTWRENWIKSQAPSWLEIYSQGHFCCSKPVWTWKFLCNTVFGEGKNEGAKGSAKIVCHIQLVKSIFH